MWVRTTTTSQLLHFGVQHESPQEGNIIVAQAKLSHRHALYLHEASQATFSTPITKFPVKIQTYNFVDVGRQIISPSIQNFVNIAFIDFEI